MQRIPRVNEAAVPEKTAVLLGAVKQQMGGVPNIVAAMAQSSAALGGYLGLAGALAGGRLSAALGEQIALAVAGANGCDYCASAHTALGRKHGLDTAELAANLQSRSGDAGTEAALRFARQVVETRGNVTDADLEAVREAGCDDEQIVEIVAHVALNIFTNYFNHVAATEIDFPVVTTGGRDAA